MDKKKTNKGLTRRIEGETRVAYSWIHVHVERRIKKAFFSLCLKICEILWSILQAYNVIITNYYIAW